MTIVHYILGFPPHRTGGMTKYALDLIEAERELKCKVIALYPGNFSLFSNQSYLIKEEENRYRIENALPVPLMYGINNPFYFYQKREIHGFNKFLKNTKPDIFHIHTLMGLPKELLVLLKNAGVKTIYTSHDYFGLCPRVNFINNRGDICIGAEKERCKNCCKDSPGQFFLKIRNSKSIVMFKKLFT